MRDKLSKKLRLGAAGLGGLLALATTAPVQAATYLGAKPLADTLKIAARECPHNKDSWRMPIITWGADEVTIFANGGLTTQPNSLLAQQGLHVQLNRQDDFSQQVQAYMSCASPFLRATLGMVAQAADLTEADPMTKGVTIYQHSWSAGGDVMVARADIHQPKDLKGKTIVLQAYGPHSDYLLRILADAGLKPSDVTLRFVKDLTGKGSETPMAAMQSDGNVAAVMVISPDAATLTSGGPGSVGSGAEGSVKGAHQILSTRSANRIITDVIVVRRDFYDAHKEDLARFGKAMYQASDQLPGAFKGKTPLWAAAMKNAASILLDDSGASADAEGLWSDAEISDRQGNARFFADLNYPKNFDAISHEAALALRQAGLSNGVYRLAAADWDWKQQTSVADVSLAAAPKFDVGSAARVATTISETAKQGDDTLFEKDIHFGINQKQFPKDIYDADFARIIDLANTYAGAVMMVEGHSDPQAYISQAQKAKNSGQGGELMLKRLAMAGKNLSIQRANEVRDAVVEAARAKGISLDPSQFVTVGLGYSQPATGMCGELPCMPKNEQEAIANRVVNFRLLNVEAETDAFAH